MALIQMMLTYSIVVNDGAFSVGSEVTESIVEYHSSSLDYFNIVEKTF